MLSTNLQDEFKKLALRVEILENQLEYTFNLKEKENLKKQINNIQDQIDNILDQYNKG